MEIAAPQRALPATVATPPATRARPGLGRTASHILAEDGRTRCGLVVDELAPAGVIVQRPGLRWPLRRCKRCRPL